MSSVSTGVETAGEKAYRRLRSDIIFGRLAPSQKLRLEALKDAYGISVSTLRELGADLRAPAPPVVNVETVRFRLSRAIAELLRRLAADRPLLVVIDDLQWADVGSARVLPVLAAFGLAYVFYLAVC